MLAATGSGHGSGIAAGSALGSGSAAAPASASAPRLIPVDDVGELYRDLARRLERFVRFEVRAPVPVIEDACQHAWSRLLDHRAEVPADMLFSWLATTASREAHKLARRDQREVSLDSELERRGEAPLGQRVAGPVDLLEQRERLASVRSLPRRQQRLLWLHVLGFSYVEIARRERCTRRTVERQLLRARRAVREAGLA